MRKIAISDIHGCARTFRLLLEKINLKRKDELFLLGDYIDRGPDSRGVVNHIFSLIDQGYKVRCLLGNHEDMMLQGFWDEFQNMLWLGNGGRITLRSFRAETCAEIPDKYLDFFRSCKKYITSDNLIFVHAGLNLNIEDPFTDEHAMMWKRYWSSDLDYEWLGDRYVFHGHTPQGKDYIIHQLEKLDEIRVINIDNGVFRTGESDKGNLCALDITNRKLYFQENKDPMDDWISNRI